MGNINLHHFEPASRANGPGLRAVIWVQGCSINCPGCFNPDTHDPSLGKWTDVNQLAERMISQPGIEGVSISGGEPFQQIPALIELLTLLRNQSELSILVFSGYTYKQLQALPGALDAMSLMDVLIAGPYLQTQRLATGLKGSTNKTIHLFSSRYSLKELEQVPEAEIIVSPAGEVFLSGIAPVEWKRDPNG